MKPEDAKFAIPDPCVVRLHWTDKDGNILGLGKLIRTLLSWGIPVKEVVTSESYGSKLHIPVTSKIAKYTHMVGEKVLFTCDDRCCLSVGHPGSVRTSVLVFRGRVCDREDYKIIFMEDEEVSNGKA